MQSTYDKYLIINSRSRQLGKRPENRWWNRVQTDAYRRKIKKLEREVKKVGADWEKSIKEWKGPHWTVMSSKKEEKRIESPLTL